MAAGTVAVGRSLKDPPLFDKYPYDRWKQEVEIWSHLTNIPTTKHGLAVYTVLPHGTKESVLNNISMEQLKSEGSLPLILEHLDTKHKKSEDQLGHEAYCALKAYRRTTETMREFVNEFERLYDKAKSYKMTVSEGVLAIILLETANLTPEQENLARATVPLKYEDMKEQLKKIFPDNVQQTSHFYAMEENEKAMFEEENQYFAQGSRQRPSNRSYKNVPKLNPPDRETGETTRCNCCQSVYHYANRCPDRFKIPSGAWTENKKQSPKPAGNKVTMYVDVDYGELTFMVGESLSMGILDTGCVTTVCGKSWFTKYRDTLSRKERDSIEREDEKKFFKFGDNPPVCSNHLYHIPAYIGNEHVTIRTHVVPEEIPLLLSKEAMKIVSTKIDLENDTVTMLGVQQKLQTLSTGHYCIPLCKPPVAEDVHHVTNTSNTNSKAAKKLHLQFGHPTSERLIRLVKNSGNSDKELISCIEEVTKECETCQVYRSPNRRPVVAIPMASTFNDVVAIDLKEITNELTTKKCWILHLVDHFSRFSAGRIITTKEKETVVEQILESWVSIFGAPNFFMTDNGKEFDNSSFRDLCDKFNIEILPTAAESPFSNGICERHHRVLYDSLTKTVLENKCSLKTALSWALSAKNSLLNNKGYSPSQIMCGALPNIPTITNSTLPALESQTSSNVVAQHLDTLHTARAEYVKSEASSKLKKAMRHNVRHTQHKLLRLNDKVYYKRERIAQWLGPARIVGLDGKTILVKHGSQIVRVHERDISKAHESDQQVDQECVDTEVKLAAEDILTFRSDESDSETENNVIEVIDEIVNEDIEQVMEDDTVPIENTEVLQTEHENSESNVNVDQNEHVHFEMETDEFAEEKLLELQAWKHHNVYEEQPLNKDNEILGLRWVLTNKGRKKARLVVKGFQETHQVSETASPTSKKYSQRLMFSIVASMGWEINMLDVSHAFLQGDNITRDVYVKPPPEVNSPETMWKLNVCVYGLPDASKAWFDKVFKELQQLHVQSSAFDPAFFWVHHENKLQGLLCVHVDDFIWGGSQWFKDNVIERLHNVFDIKSDMNCSFEYLGLNIHQDDDMSISVDQLQYKEKFQPIPLKVNEHPLNEVSQANFELFRSLCGRLTWMSNCTRPDLSFDASYLSSVIQRTANQDIKRINKIINYKILSGKRDVVLKFNSLGDPHDWHIRCYADASHRNLYDGGSQAGCVITLENQQSGEANIIHWFSHRISRIVSSPLAAETLALNESLEAAYGINKLLCSILLVSPDSMITAVTDSKSLYDHIQTKKTVQPKLLLEINKLRESQDNGEIDLVWVKTGDQLADSLTAKDRNVQQLTVKLLNKM